MKKIYTLYGLFWLLALLAVFWFSGMAGQANQGTENSTVTYQSRFVDGQVVGVKGNDFLVRLSDRANEVIQTRLDNSFVHDDYKRGDHVTLYFSQNEAGETQYDIADYYHLDGLILGFLIFCGLAVVVGRKKGLSSIVSVLLSLFFFIPLC